MSPPIDNVTPLSRDNLWAFDAAPKVSAASRPWVAPLGVAAAVGLGILTFATLNGARLQHETSTAPTPTLATTLPPASAPAPLAPVTTPPADETLLASASRQNAAEAETRLRAPAMIVDLSAHGASGAQSAVDASSVSAALGGEALTGDERFSARLGGGGQTAQARALTNPRTTIPQGVIIAGVLETAINSDLPGYVRALVSRDVRSFDGSTVLVPRGSRLIGQYRAATALGQSRAFVIWTRLMRPDGVAIDLNSPGADALGRGGLAGETDRHFIRRFGSAMLLTAFGAAANAAADTQTQVIIGATRNDAASIALDEEIAIGPTIRVPQGEPVRIFVSRDLDFSAVGAAP